MGKEIFRNDFENNISPEVEAREVFEFRENNLEGKWLILKNKENEELEGSLYKPSKEKSNGEAVIFHPGIPGDGVTWFEKNHVGNLVNNGYEVFVARHRGLKYDQKGSDLVNNQERLKYGKLNDIDNPDWLSEPEESIKYFSDRDDIKSITLITHSFSGLSAAKSLIEIQDEFKNKNNNPLNKLNKWLSLSGMTLNIEEDGVLDHPPTGEVTLDLYKNLLSTHFSEFYNISDTEIMVAKLEEAMSKMKSSLKDIPENISVIGVYPEKDSLITIKAGDDLQKNLGRGLIVDDRTFRKEKLTNNEAHNFPHLLTETMLRLMKMKTSKHGHRVTVNNPDKKGDYGS